MKLPEPVDGEIRTEEEIQTFLVENLAPVLRTTPDQISIHDNLANYGIDSLEAMTLLGKLSDRCEVDVDFDILWDYPTISAISKHLAERIKEEE